MRVRNTAGFDFSIQLPGALRPLQILPATGVHSVPKEYLACKQCQGLLEKGWLELVVEEPRVALVPKVEPTPSPTSTRPKRRRRVAEKAELSASDVPDGSNESKADD